MTVEGEVNEVEEFTKIAPILVSILALGISIWNVFNVKKEIIANTVAADRMEWIAQVRNLIGDFLEKYIRQDGENELKIIKAKIDLYIVYGKGPYIDFEKKMNYCIQNKYTDSDYRELVTLSQKVLNDVWRRRKIESGISIREEKQIVNLVRKRDNSGRR